MSSASPALTSIGKLLVATGLILALAGLLVYVMGRWSGAGERGLPGDFVVRIGGVTVYLPLATCILLSILLSVLLTVGWSLAAALRR